jgi:acetoin utilization deacetylase AcuC-like enzyme
LEAGKLHCWFADHQVVTLPGGHRFPMDKYRITRMLLQHEAQTAKMAHFHPSPAATLQDLHRVHTADYVQRFVSGDLTKQDMRMIGFPWSPSLVARNLASVGGTLAATRAVLERPDLRMAAHIAGVLCECCAHQPVCMQSECPCQKPHLEKSKNEEF